MKSDKHEIGKMISDLIWFELFLLFSGIEDCCEGNRER